MTIREEAEKDAGYLMVPDDIDFTACEPLDLSTCLEDDIEWAECRHCGRLIFPQTVTVWEHEGGTPPQDHEAEVR